MTEEVWEDLKDNEKYNDPDSLTFKQILHMDRHADIIDLAYRNKFWLLVTTTRGEAFLPFLIF